MSTPNANDNPKPSARDILDAAKKPPTAAEFRQMVATRVAERVAEDNQARAADTARRRETFLKVSKLAWEKQYPNHPFDPKESEAFFDKHKTGQPYASNTEAGLTPAQKQRMADNLRKFGVPEASIQAATQGRTPDTRTPEELAADAAAAKEHLAAVALAKGNHPATGSADYRGEIDDTTRQALFQGGFAPAHGSELAHALAAGAKTWEAMSEPDRLTFIAQTEERLSKEMSVEDRAKMMTLSRLALKEMNVGRDHPLLAGGALNSLEVFRLLAAHGARIQARKGKSK